MRKTTEYKNNIIVIYIILHISFVLFEPLYNSLIHRKTAFVFHNSICSPNIQSLKLRFYNIYLIKLMIIIKNNNFVRLSRK